MGGHVGGKEAEAGAIPRLVDLAVGWDVGIPLERKSFKDVGTTVHRCWHNILFHGWVGRKIEAARVKEVARSCIVIGVLYGDCIHCRWKLNGSEIHLDSCCRVDEVPNALLGRHLVDPEAALEARVADRIRLLHGDKWGLVESNRVEDVLLIGQDVCIRECENSSGYR